MLLENRPDVVANLDGATGAVAERDLFIKLRDSDTLAVWDNGVYMPGSPISTDVPPGITYDLLLNPRLDEVEYYPPQAEIPFDSELWQGVVLDSHWQAPHQPYLCAVNNLEQRAWVLLYTAIGQVVANYSEIGVRVQTGGVVGWWPRRMSLLAVVAPASTPILTSPVHRITALDNQRQLFLQRCLSVVPDISNGNYPFAQVVLSRLDVEWLLANHQSSSLSGVITGPVDWSDASQRDRVGLDLRGADLRGVDLSNLPLARTIGSLFGQEWLSATPQQRELATIHAEGINGSGTHFEAAYLRGAHLEYADMTASHCESAVLRGAVLSHAKLTQSHLAQAYLSGAVLLDADLTGANLEKSDLILTNMERANLFGANLQAVNAQRTNMQGASLRNVYAAQAYFYGADLMQADLSDSHLDNVNLSLAHTEGTRLDNIDGTGIVFPH